MPCISIKIDSQLKDRLAKFSEKKKVSTSELIRKLVESGLEVAEYKEKNDRKSDANFNTTDANTTSQNALPDKQELEAEYKWNFEFMMLEVASLLHLIVATSGKFTTEEAKKLLDTAHHQVKTYMQHYANVGVVKMHLRNESCSKKDA